MLNDLPTMLAQGFKEGRKGKRWSQVDLAHHSGVNLGTIQGVEQERKLPNIRSIMKVLDALDLEVKVLPRSGQSGIPLSTERKNTLAQVVSPPPPPEQEEEEDAEEEYGEAERAGDEEIVKLFRKKFPDTMAPEALMFLRKQPAILESANRLGIGL